MGKRNIFVDIFKLLLVFLVVCIHYHPYFEQYAIFRMGVPAFFLISGFYQYNKCSEESKKKSIKFIKGTLKYIIFGLLVFVIFDLVIAFIDKKSIAGVFSGFFYKDFLLNFIFYNLPVTSGYHLWFLIAMFVVSLIHYVLVKYNKTNIYKYTFLLLVIPFFFSGLLFRINGEFVSTALTRNAIFTGLPLFSIGYELARRNKKRRVYELIIFFILGSLFFYTQHLERIYVFKTQIEIYLSSILSSIFFVLFFTNLPSVKSKIYYLIFGRQASLYTYIFHIMIGKIMINYFGKVRSWEVCFLAFFISLGIAILINGIIVLSKFLYKKYKLHNLDHS